MTDTIRKIYSLSSVAKAIANRLAPITNQKYWVQAEVTQPKEVGGHMYATLVELRDGKQVAKLNCAIWRDHLAAIRRKFKKEELTFDFQHGTKVCLLCSVSFHAIGGLKLIVHDADTSFQLGEMERRRREIIQRLEAEKLHERNRALTVPMLPRRIGLITGKDSAAMNDIRRTLRDGGYSVTVFLAESLMQGNKCEASLLRAMDALERLGVDLITLARGGGGKSELASLDNEVIARRIAECTTPVWTAIGHETDTSVLDFVSHTQFKTPTAMAEEIVRRYREQETAVSRALDRIRREWSHRFEADLREQNDNITGIRQGTRKLHDLAVSELHSSAEQLRSFVGTRFADERSVIAVSATRVRNASRRMIDGQRQFLQVSERDLTASSRRCIGLATDTLTRNRGRLSVDRITRLLAAEQRRFSLRISDVRRAMDGAVTFRSERLHHATQRIRQGNVPARFQNEDRVLSERRRFVLAHDPTQQLKRGYAIVRSHDKRFLKSIAAVKPGDDIDIEFHDGLASANIHHTEERQHGRTENL